jgi:hypothetical protein
MGRQVSVIAGLALMLVSASGRATPTFETFPEAIHSCRLMQPGRMLWRSSLPSTHPGVATCLARHGWSADGRSLRSSDSTTGAST